MQEDFFKNLFDASKPEPEPEPPKPALLDIDTLRTSMKALLTKIGAGPLAKRMRIEWNPRMRSTAGLAYPARALIRINPRLLEFGEAEVDRTLRHEVAHLLAHDRAGKRRIAAHGPEWHQACRDLGIPDESRTHTLPLPRHTVARKHFYRCPSCGVEVARVIPLRRGSACLKCCRKHNRGRYHEKFRFERMLVPGVGQSK